MSNIHTLYREPTTRTAKDTKTGATHRIEVTVHEVLDYDRESGAYRFSRTTISVENKVRPYSDTNTHARVCCLHG